MSLNGLDSAPVVEAYQSALADAGGWFLLHYVSRDEVALHERGNGGVPEIRNAIDGYEECSPLYGFLQYRRRKVIIRYMPEGLSRLILARSNVQFQSVTDKFSPNDTVLPLSKASDLTESALSSACLLHTASTSITSSSSSLRRRRLMEITEDAEENGTKDDEASKPVPPPQSEARRAPRSVKSEATLVPSPIEPPVEPELPPTSPESEKASVDLMPPPSRASSRATISRGSPIEPQSATMSPKSVKSNRSRSSSRYRAILDEFPRPSEEARLSTQSSRPSIQDLERAAGYTPKVKLGPRPSVDSSGRPRTAGSTRNADQRPVASLPTNMRSSSVRKQNGDAPRPRSQGSTFATKPTSRVPPVPPLLVPPPSIPISRPQLSPGAKSLGALSTSSGLTPEKERLMKALQQRKKNMAKRAEETKMKQVSEERELKPVKDIAEYPDDDKENLIQIHYPDSEMLLSEPETIQQDQQELPSANSSPPEPAPELVPESILEPSFEPVHDSSPELAPEPVPETTVESAPEPVVEAVAERIPELASESVGPISEAVLEPVADPIVEPAVTLETEQPSKSLEADSEQISDISSANAEDMPSLPAGTSVDNPISADRGATPSETVKAETLQPPPEGETRNEHEDSAIPAVAPPTFNPDAPLQNEPSGVPRPDSEDVPETQLEISPVAHVPTDEPSEVPISAEALEAVPLPSAPSITPPESTGTETPAAPALVSGEQAETTPDHPIAEKAEPLTLDQRRKIHLEPIQVPTVEFSDDDNLLSDDSFMEELTSATVQEARPVSVKSPNGVDHAWRNSRAVSSPFSMGSSSGMQNLAVGRSISSSHSENGPSTPVLMAKKINVSSGISSRIKALEKFSSREGTPSAASPAVSGPSASSSFENLRKRASTSVPSGNHESTPSSTMHSAHVLDGFSRAPSLSRHNRQVSVDATCPANSVSVTARIVRDADISPGSSGLEPSESDVVNLQASPLTVEHETAEAPLPQVSPLEPASRSQDRSTSISSTTSSRQATSRPDSRPSLPSRSRTDDSVQSASSTSEDKKISRTSRLMRRMSSITSNSRRSIIGALSSPVKEEEYVPTTNGTSKAPGSSSSRTSEPIDIGEVNVQFPETLLWKRRVMRIDEEGYVVLTPSTNDATTRNMTKRYHLSEFRTPCLPDEDMQELPNSILLDFLDGNTLQCACESRQGQASALQTLVEAHSAHQQ
ncbi:unnamed protein product [Penicillium nalgiovense]|uniref:ADF-H domain-containing protein n=1 Tax=Penicillium nalgiovense TaxID=60175 RepID=A0A9W4I6K8_PENNA|nr:unnamed protein product [Penicillium nalgiovense]CAG7941971.1 unnamed protein product [Penicillium nalgiovense]CAG7942129.1 unnamed protein product [Penicillium nalgiovense]CAG7953592.1 unnamed protein product [Penicillium nalgiovense]CAG7974521.1 unnamed protein product [Penicillium nalgiovense]